MHHSKEQVERISRVLPRLTTDFEVLAEHQDGHGSRSSIPRQRPTSQDEHKTIFDGLIDKFVQESGDGTLHLDRLPVRLLSDQAFTLLLAGTETTATTMVFLLHLLSENRHEESRLLHDLKKLGDMRDPRYDFRAASNLPIVVC